jgi:hypothetical protein
MHRILADLSRLLSRMTGGRAGTTLCHRIAMAWGWDCLFCRAVAAALRDRDHCLAELSAADIVSRKRGH